MEDSIAGVDLSVTSVDKVTCLVIKKMNLLSILSPESLRDITDPRSEGLVGIPMSEIQKNYVDKLQWKEYRSELVQNVVEKKPTIKRK